MPGTARRTAVLSPLWTVLHKFILADCFGGTCVVRLLTFPVLQQRILDVPNHWLHCARPCAGLYLIFMGIPYAGENEWGRILL